MVRNVHDKGQLYRSGHLHLMWKKDDHLPGKLEGLKVLDEDDQVRIVLTNYICKVNPDFCK